MRAIFFIALSFAFACTKPNPDLCCNDADDCAAQGLPDSNACAEGLVCRGNQCIAETCAGASDCDAAAPYCDGQTCIEQCTMDSECPGFGGSASDPFCVGGGCVQCRMGMDDCAGNTPICDSNACRGCDADTECASGLCNLGTGACVDASTVLYASPSGAETADCSQATPCSITEAIGSVTVSKNTILMAAGTYASPVVISSGATMTLLGSGATLGARLTVANNSNVTIQDLNMLNGMWCFDETTAPDSQLSVVQSVVASPESDGDEFKLRHCHMKWSQVTYMTYPVQATSTVVGMYDEATFVADRSSLPGVLLDSEPIIATVSASNSIFNGTGIATPGAGANTVTVDVSFSTYYNSVLDCPAGSSAGVVYNFSNDIIYSPSFSSTVNGGSCYDHVIAYPQAGNAIAGLIVVDPLLKDPANGDFHLSAGSPAIDAADSSVTDDHDYDGVTRPQGAGPDIGAFEYH